MSYTVDVIGTQQRGTAVGSLRRWTPDAWTVLTGGSTVPLESVNVPDVLALTIYLEVQTGGAVNINAFLVEVSEDNTNWTQIYMKFVKGTGVAPGTKLLVADIGGWKYPYVRVTVLSTGVGTSNIKAYFIGSIFSAGITVFNPDDISAYSKKNTVNTVSNTPTAITSDTPGSNDGVDLTGFSNPEEVFYRIVPSTTPVDYRVWVKDQTGTWAILQEEIGIYLPIIRGIRVRNFNRVGIQIKTGAATQLIEAVI
jgi:hypothetical protein